MASDPVTKKMREDATCFICQELMTEPTSIDCGHSFCNSCILRNARQSFLIRRCPLCQTPFRRMSLRPNKQLQNLIEVLKNMGSKNLCEEHGEKLHLFCEDDDQVICWCCERSPQHKGHVTLLVTDACKVYKEKLQKTVATLRNLEEECQQKTTFTKEHIIECEEWMKDQKQKIQSDFRNLQKFLQEEENSHLWRLEKEKKKVLKRLRDNEANLQEQMQQLKKHIEELEEKCQGSAKNLLQDVKVTLTRSSAVRLALPETVPLDLNMTCNVSELYLDLKKVLKRYQVNVTLDPKTAHPALTLTKNNRKVIRECNQLKPDSSTRFTALCCVLGYERFTSGRCYFEVDVRGVTQCDLGVCWENVPRDVDMTVEPASGFWGIRLFQHKSCTALASPRTTLSQRKPDIIGIFLDWEAGRVSFYNMDTGFHIYTFPRTSFSSTLRPFFRVFPDSFLFLPPK